MKTSKLLVTSLLAAAAMSVPAHAAGEVISINFGKTEDNITANMRENAGLVTYTNGSGEAVTGVGAAGWSNATGRDGTNSELKNYNGDTIEGASVTWVGAQGPYAGGPTPTGSVLSAIQHSYMDLSANNKWNISVDTPFLVCDVYLYFSGDGGKYSPVNVNGTSYIGGTNVLAGDTTEWGDREQSTSGTLALGTNAILVTGTAGALSLSNVPQGTQAKRATISGMQIVNSYAGTAHAATLGGDSAWSSVSFDTAWANSQSTVDAATGQITSTNGAYADFTLTADTTLTFDSAVVTDAIYVSGEGKTLTLSNAGSGSLTLSGRATLRANAGATLAFDTSIFNLADNVSDIKLAGAGTIAFTDADGAAAYNKIGTDFTASSNTTVRIDGAVNLGESALVVSSGIREFAGGLTAGAVTVSGGTLILGGASTSFTSANVSSGTLKFDIGADATMNLNHTLTNNGSLFVDSGTLVLTHGDLYGRTTVATGAVLDLTRNARSANSGGSGNLDISGGIVKIANLGWGAGANFGANFNYDRVQLSNGGVLDVTSAQPNGTGAGERGFSVIAGTGTYRFSGTGNSYSVDGSANQLISIADGAELVFDVVEASASLTVSKLIARGTDSSRGTSERSTGSVTKKGEGTLMLSHANNYSGGTTIERGTLVAANASALGAGNVSVANGATLERGLASGSVAIGGTLTTNGSAKLVLGALNTTTAAIAAQGDVRLSAGTIFDVGALVEDGKVVSSAGTLTAADVTSGVVSELSIANIYVGGYLANQRGSATFSVKDNTLVLSAYTAGEAWNITWNGGDAGVWKANGSGWTKDGDSTAANFQHGDSVTFGTDTTNTATLEGSLNVGALTVSANTTFSVADGSTALVTTGTLSLDANLTINDGVTLKLTSVPNTDTRYDGSKILGSGTFAFSASTSGNGSGVNLSEFNGEAYLTGGLLRLGDATCYSSFGANASLRVAAGAALVFNGTASQDGSTFSNDVTFEGNSTIHANSGKAGTLSGAVIATGTLTKAGAGALTLSGTSNINTLNITGGTEMTLSGTSVSIGTLENTSASTINIGTGSGDTKVVAVGRFDVGDYQGDNTNELNIKSDAVLKITGSVDTTYNCSLLLGEWGGKTVLNLEGKLLAAGAKANVGDKGADLNVNSGAVLAVKGIGLAETKNGKTQKIVLNIADKGTLILGASGIGTDATKDWTSSLGAGTIGTSSSTGTTIETRLTLTSATGTTFDTQLWNFAPDGNDIARSADTESSITVNGEISGEGGIKKIGAGTLTLSGDNTFTGGVTLSAGTLELGHNNALGTGTVNVSGNSELKLGSAASRNALEISNELSLRSALTVSSTHDGNKLSGKISAFGQEIRKIGSGTLTLSGTNTEDSFFIVNIAEGKIIAGSDTALGATLAAGYAGLADYHKVRLSGGHLEVSSGVILAQTNIEIALSDAYSSTAAITGAGELAADTVVTISSIDTADLVGVSLLAESAITRYDFKIAETTLTPGLTKDDFSLAQDLQDSGWEIAGYADGTLSLTLTVPEPSVFGLLAGLGALALAGTRRRRQKKA